MRKGFIQTYNKSKGVGTIVSDRDRFWFQRDRIAKGPLDPQANDEVLFEISPKPILPGKLPVAILIVILEDLSAGVKTLADTEVKS